MSLLARTSLRARLSIPVGVCLAVLTGATAYSALRLGAIDGDAAATERLRVPQLRRVSLIELKTTQASLNLRHAMLARDTQEQAATLVQIGELKRQIDGLVDEYVAAATDDADRAGARALADRTRALWPVFERNLTLVKAVQPGHAEAEAVRTAAFTFLVNQTVPARNALLQAAAEAVADQQKALSADLGAVQVHTARLRGLLIALTGGFSLALGLAVWGALRVLRRRVDTLNEAADRVRAGDFTQPVRDAARDEFSPLLATMGAMQDNLADLVRSVRQNAESVATASAQIAQGNQDLSHRTEEQAGALQVTASTMEQLGATVRHNADNAGQADQLAREACEMAEQGGLRVGQVVQTMRLIDESARRIADITGTIDGIAFQTNILALNAAVEAARAGEQGRGFAVVAGEVRTLAQRSAEAARQIKTLIGTSVERVDEGSRLVDEAGTSMHAMVEAIRRVAGIVGEIRTASAEQADGVGQVGRAVTEMDGSTQQNAALVEQSAAAADSLRRQARQLVDAVGVFRLGAETGA